MPRLTWQNIAAPDFRGIGENYERMSRLLGNAAQSGQNMLGIFQNAHQQAADRNILQRQAGVPNAASFDPTAVIGSDGAYASLDTLRNVRDQRSRLLADDTVSQALAEAAYGHGRTVDRDARLDAARDDIATNYAFGARGSGAHVNNLHELSSLRNLDPNDLFDVLTNANELYGGWRDSKRATIRDGWEVAEYEDREDAMEAAGRVNAASSSQRARAEAIERERRSLSPRAFHLLEQAVQGQSGWGDTRAPMNAGGMSPPTSSPSFSPTSSSSTRGGDAGGRGSSSFRGGGSRGSGSGRAGAGIRLTKPEYTVRNTISSWDYSPAVVAGFLANFRVEGGYDGGQGDNKTAGGIAQWRGPRREQFKKIIGKDPTEATVDEQLRYVKWEMDNPTHPSVGMTVEQRDAILNASTAEEAAELIDKHYERSSGEHRRRRVNYASSFYQALEQDERDESWTPEIAKRFEGFIGQEINGIRISSDNLARMVENFGVDETRSYLDSRGRHDPLSEEGYRMSEIAEAAAYEGRTPEQSQDVAEEDIVLRMIREGRQRATGLGRDTLDLYRGRTDSEGNPVNFSLTDAVNELKENPNFKHVPTSRLNYLLRYARDRGVPMEVAVRAIEQSGSNEGVGFWRGLIDPRSYSFPDRLNPFAGLFGIYEPIPRDVELDSFNRLINEHIPRDPSGKSGEFGRYNPEGTSDAERQLLRDRRTNAMIQERAELVARIGQLQATLEVAVNDPRQDRARADMQRELAQLVQRQNQLSQQIGGAASPDPGQQDIAELYEFLGPQLTQELNDPTTPPERVQQITEMIRRFAEMEIPEPEPPPPPKPVAVVRPRTGLKHAGVPYW